MSAVTRVDEFGVVRCAADPGHVRLMVLHADHQITVKCLDCDVDFDAEKAAS